MEDSVRRLSSWERVWTSIAAIFAIAVSLTGILISWISRLTAARRHRQSYRLPPGPKGWPLVGVLPSLTECPYMTLHDMSKKYGPVMSIRMGSVPVVMISNAEMAKEVLQTNDQLFASRPHFLIAACFSYGRKDIAWAPYGCHWRHVRKIATAQLLAPSKLANFKTVLKDEILITIQSLLRQSKSRKRNIVDIKTLFDGMMMNIMTQMIWNRRHRNLKGRHSWNDKKFESRTKNVLMLAGCSADFMSPILQFIAMRHWGLNKKVRDVHKQMDNFCETIICEREQALAKEASATEDDDFLGHLLKAMNQAEDSQGLSRDAVKAVLTDMLIAGTDTTAMTLARTLMELLTHPHVMRKAEDELTAVVGKDRLVCESDIPNLKYLDAVVKEVLRKSGPAPIGLPHFSTADCKVGGYDIPANTTIFINHFAVHHDSAAWENPWGFDPDRFLHSDKDYKGRSFEFIPFSSGRRMCPGINLASNVLHLGLAQLLHTVEWSLPENQAVETVTLPDLSCLCTPEENPLVMDVRRRLARHVVYPDAA